MLLTFQIGDRKKQCTFSLRDMLTPMALCAQRDQVLGRVVPSLAPMFDVVDLQVGSRPTGLTSPPIAPQHFIP
jgi:hypothetical protein